MPVSAKNKKSPAAKAKTVRPSKKSKKDSAKKTKKTKGETASRKNSKKVKAKRVVEGKKRKRTLSQKKSAKLDDSKAMAVEKSVADSNPAKKARVEAKDAASPSPAATTAEFRKKHEMVNALFLY